MLRLSKGAILLKVSCPPGQACSGSVTVATAKPSRLTLGKAAYRLAGGRATTLRVKVSGRGLQLLRRLGKLRVTVTTTTRDASGRQAKASWIRTLRR